MKFLIILLTSFLFNLVYGAECSFCIDEDQKIKEEVSSFLELSSKDQLLKVEKLGIRVLILNSDRPLNSPFFQWKKERVDQGSLSEVSQLESSMGKTLCKDEIKIAKSKYNIILNADAPRSTLLHEYLHVLQIIKEEKWCEISKKIWNKKTIETSENIEIRNREWDVRKTLWRTREHQSYSIEDRIIIAEGLMNEAKLRAAFDKSAPLYVEKENVIQFLNQNIESFKQSLLKK
jgi:hypothetical protein